MHVHPYPCLIPRIATDREIVQGAEEAGLTAILLKCHHESTVSRASTLQEEFQSIKVFGGIVLNQYVGGINPSAVEAALRLGAKEIWMPTTDAHNHAQVFGSTGTYGLQSTGSASSKRGINVLDDASLTPETKEVLSLIAGYDAILGTGHLAKQEIFKLVKEAIEIGVKKILITHPYFKVPGFTLEELKELSLKHVIFEFGYCTVSPMWRYASIDKVYASIKELGTERCILVSDGGQRHNPMPHQGLQLFAQSLMEKGMLEEEIFTMIRTTPQALLSLT